MDPRDPHAVTLDEMRSFRAASDPSVSRRRRLQTSDQTEAS